MTEQKGMSVESVEKAQELLSELAKDASINKPTEEETQAAEKEFDLASKAFNSKMFVLGEKKEFDEISDFVLLFLEKFVYWTKNGWMGVLKMHDEVSEFKKKRKKEPFSVGYQALEFLFFALTNPGGSGIESAREIEKHAEIYGKLVELTGKSVEDARAELKEIQWLQEKWNAMLQGFYIEKEDGVEPVDEKEAVEETVEA